MIVVVQRSPGDKQGPDINDPLITSEPVAVERGRNEIDANCSSRQLVTMEIVPRSGLRINRIIEVQALTGAPWRGLLTDISITMAREEERVNRAMILTIEKEVAP